MTARAKCRRPGGGSLQNISLSRKEDWRRWVYAPSRQRPEVLSGAQIKALSPAATLSYNTLRNDWHANIGTLRTPQLQALHENLWDIVDSNVQDGDKAKGAVAIDAFPGLGKTTAVEKFAKEFHLREIAADGERTRGGHERWPVCRVSLTGSTTLRDFNRALLEFFAHPGSDRGTAAQYIRRALDCVLSCEVRLLIVDDLHFLRWTSTSGVEVSNHLKYIANEFPVTLVFIGVGLSERGLFTEGTCMENAVLAQTGRRTTVLGMEPFVVTNDTGRRQWKALLKAIEQRLVLAHNHEGMLAEELADYLFARSSGHIGSLMTLINRGCVRAVRTGTERLTEELLDQLPIDAAAEQARAELEAKMRCGKLRARLR
jgi:AAA domain